MKFRSFGEDGSTDPEAFRFLGMSVQQWATMPVNCWRSSA